MKTIDFETIERVRQFSNTNLSEARYKHSINVAETAEMLAKKFGEDEKLAYFAGLCHDMCKEMDKKILVKIIEQESEILSYSETLQPGLLHGRVCGIMLQKSFGIQHNILVEAVTHHTFGKCNMHNISKIVCIADKIEPTRQYMTTQKMKNYLKLDLDEMLFLVLSEIIEKRRSEKEDVFPDALWIYDL